MKTREAIAAGIVVIGMGLGANALLESSTPEEFQQQRQEQMESDLQDSQDTSDQKKQDDANDLVNSEEDKKRVPVVPDPEGKGPHLPKLPFPWK